MYNMKPNFVYRFNSMGQKLHGNSSNQKPIRVYFDIWFALMEY